MTQHCTFSSGFGKQCVRTMISRCCKLLSSWTIPNVGTATRGKKRGRGTDKAKLIVAVSQDTNGKAAYIKMQTVSNLKAATYGRFAKRYIVASSRIESDNFRAVKKGLAQKYFVYYQTFSPEKEMLTNLHTAISNMKAMLNGMYHGVTKNRL